MNDTGPKKILSEDEAKDLIKGNARDLLKKTHELGVDMSDLKFDVRKYLIQDGLGMTESTSLAVDFVFWVAYFIEKIANDLIIDPQVHIGAQKITMETLVGQLSFGSKINVMEKLYVSKKDPLIKMMRKVQDLRNYVAHGRFEELLYEGYKLDKGHGQILMIADIRDAFLKKTEETSVV